MKKLLLSLAVVAFLASCGGTEVANNEGADASADTNVVAVDTAAKVAPVTIVADTVAVVDTNAVDANTTAVVDTTAK